MFTKLSLLFKVFQSGGQVADTKFWARSQAYCLPVVAGIIMGVVQLAQSFGYTIPVDQDTAMWAASLIYFIANSAITVANHPALGIPSSKPTEPSDAVMYGIPDNPVQMVEDLSEEATEVLESAVEDVVADVKQDALAAAQEWLKRNK